MCPVPNIRTNHRSQPTTYPWMMPRKPWSRIHVDYAINFMGNNWLIVTDAYSKHPCIHQTSSTSTQATTTLLKKDFAHFGYPHTIVSDNGTTFSSAEFQLWCHQRGIKHLTGAPYHPANNGAADRMVESFKQSLKKSKLPPRPALQEFLMQYRRTPLNTGFSLSQFLNGRQLRTKIDTLPPKNIKPVKPPRARKRNRQQLSTFVQHTMWHSLLRSVLWSSSNHYTKMGSGFRLQSLESMALEHSPSKCIPENHYENATWNNFNLATELSRIPTPCCHQ